MIARTALEWLLGNVGTDGAEHRFLGSLREIFGNPLGERFGAQAHAVAEFKKQSKSAMENAPVEPDVVDAFVTNPEENYNA